jgi:photosystem II stability/assembly factor-like uncharacterized protein
MSLVRKTAVLAAGAAVVVFAYAAAAAGEVAGLGHPETSRASSQPSTARPVSAQTALPPTVLTPLPAAVTTPDGAWLWSLPRPQGLDLSSIRFADPAHGFAVGDFPFILSTSDAGASWTPLSIQGVVPAARLTSLSFFDSTHGWVCGTVPGERDAYDVVQPDRAFVAATADGGLTWSVQGSWPKCGLEEIDFSSDLNGWTVGSRWSDEHRQWIPAVLHTADGGQSWQTQEAIARGATSLSRVDAIDDQHAAALCESAGLASVAFVTADGGADWAATLRTDSDTELRDIAFSDAQHGWAVGRFATVFRTTDGAHSWQKLQGSSWDFDYSYATIEATPDGTLWVCGPELRTATGSVVMYSGDGGAKWAASGATSAGSLLALDMHSGWAWASGLGGALAVSGDGGRTWQARSAGHVGFIGSITSTSPDGAWAAAGADGVLHTSDGGITWHRVTRPVGFGQASILSVSAGGTRLWAVGPGGVVLRSNDRGRHWAGRRLPLRPYLTTVACVGTQRAWLGGGNSIYATTNGGRTWRLQLARRDTMIDAISFADLRHGFAIGNEGTVLRTTDGGRHWQRRSLGDQILGNLAVRDAQHAWITEPQGAFLTDDGGRTWRRTALKFLDIDFLTGSEAFAASSGTLWRSGDGGTTWIPVGTLPIAFTLDLEFFDAGHGWLAGLAQDSYDSAQNSVLLRTAPAFSPGTAGQREEFVP